MKRQKTGVGHAMARKLLVLLTFLLALTCTGCGIKFTSNPLELYSLPQLPDKYKELGTQLNAILESGAEYAAPTGGTNIQTVQMQDLDGDGSQEAVAFFRNAKHEKPLKVYIFTAKGDSYEQAALIEGSGSSIYSVAYSDLDQDGRVELAIGWRVSTDLQVLTIYRVTDSEPKELVRTPYVRYKLIDLDQNGLQELIVLRADDEGNGIADYYHWHGNEFAAGSSAAISMTMAELTQQGRVSRGTLRDGAPALYVTGVEESSTAVTDILAVRKGDLVNIAISDSTGVSTEIAEFQSLYPSDIDSDGLTEIPCPVALPGKSGNTFYRTDWRGYYLDGSADVLFSTYHDVDDGWYLWIPGSWRDCVSIERIASSDEAVVTFNYIGRDENDDVLTFLRIITLRGSDRELKAARSNRIILGRQMDTVYAAELPELPNLHWNSEMDEESLRSAFNLIAIEWTEGEN